MSHINKFKDKNLLIRALMAQSLVKDKKHVSKSIAKKCVLKELNSGDTLILQDDPGDEIFFILSGKVKIVVNGQVVATRTNSEHIGEMSLIEPGLKRTASVIATELTVVAGVKENRFTKIADEYPYLWRGLATTLANRLKERSKFHRMPNPLPIVFIGSSSEGIDIANKIAPEIPPDTAQVIIWNKDVFGASDHTMESLETQLKTADFAILIASLDDNVKSRKKEYKSPRDNVILEFGLFMGALGRKRSILVAQKSVKIPTDLNGITYLPLDKNKNNITDKAIADISSAITNRIKTLGSR